MRLAVLLFLCALSASAIAADRNSKIRELMEAQGLLRMFQQQMEEGKQESRAQAERMLEQFIDGLKPPKEFEERFRVASREFIDSLVPTWSAEDIVAEWAKAYGARFTDEELDGLVRYYESPLGRKDVSASQEALPELTAHFQSLSKPIVQRAMQKYIERLQAIARECNCRK